MSGKTRLPPKKDVALALLEKSTLFLHLDPRHAEAMVPPWFKKQPQLVLQVGLNMAVPIPDLNLDDSGVSCTLSFNRSPHYCFVPWAAIYALVGEDGRGMVWPDDVPPEVAAQVQSQAAETKPRARLRAVEGEGSPTQPAPPELALADSSEPPPPPPAESPQEKKKTRKKAAKPRPAPAAAKRDPRAARPMLAPVDTASAPQARPEKEKSGGESAKKKRELPPYLRIVK